MSGPCSCNATHTPSAVCGWPGNGPRPFEPTTVDQFVLRWVPHRLYPDGTGGWVRDRDRAMLADLHRMLWGAK